ncbi:wall-associated receptor kinase-like 1 [Quercus robur]|uniref:wall-associated receptor kinase-like 1 n=1 Tax=Quercus robur TaxID=38942 RepID=UPI0021627E71|nr:wall-associated receptor kinase-like 1 [Quercus robur]
MGVQFLMRITFLLLLTYGLAAAAPPPMVKPNCVEFCGNVSIPYPFGMTTAGCYLNDWFRINCTGKGSSARAFLPRINMEVLEINITNPYRNDSYISFEPSIVRVKMPIIISSNCANTVPSNSSVNMKGSPFYFSSYRNKFISVGCNNMALMTGSDPTVLVGCNSDCDGKTMIDREAKCSGFNCCQTTVPYGNQVFNVTFKSKNGKNKGSKKCKYAFLAEEEWFDSNITNPSYEVPLLEYVPVALEWTVSNFTDMNSTEADRRKVNCYEGRQYYCRYGYEGNPYLNTGCQDINECEKDNRCPNKSDCENTEGSYNCDRGKTRSKILKIAIIVICTSFGVLFLLLITWWLYKVIKKRNKIKLKQKFFKRNGGLLLQQQLSSNENNVQKAKLFNSKELETTTDHFNENRILGKGGQGTVYKGMLVDGRIVAIKKCNIVDEGNLEQFINEIIILSQINHRNVVKLLGCCLETEVPLLVYEFIPNGTLFQYLHEENEDFPLLTWEMRLRIATEIAGALSYLHSAASLPIYHRDIKSSNILLDEKYRTKVADFGTSKSVAIDQTHVTTLVYGTFGYLDPEYFQTSQFTEKSDVYSFGVVLVELLTGEKPVSLTRSQERRNLSTYFVHSLKENRLFDILDTQVSKVDNKDEVMKIANLAKRCLHFNGKKRPTMLEIMMELEGVQNISPVQPNFEELEYVGNEEMGPWNDVSFQQLHV